MLNSREMSRRSLFRSWQEGEGFWGKRRGSSQLNMEGQEEWSVLGRMEQGFFIMRQRSCGGRLMKGGEFEGESHFGR